MDPKDNFWIVSIKLMTEDEKGKIKTVRETHLVDGPDVSTVETKVKEEMNGTIADYDIVSVKKSDIITVY